MDEDGLRAFWEKIKGRIDSGVGSIDLSPYLKTANLATVNGQKLSDGGNVTIDLTLFKIVDSLPTSGIDSTKIYLVANDETSGSNVYTEYIYANGKWEVLGEYKSDIDLSPYAKVDDVNTALSAKVDKVNGKQLSTNDFTAAYKSKLDNIEDKANSYILPVASASALGGIKVGTNLSINSNGVLSSTNTTYGAATNTADGLMSKEDKSKLDGIATNANNYTHPTSKAGALASGLYKVTTDEYGHVTAATAAAKADITALGIPAQDTTYAAMKGATSSANGTTGLVPVPAAGKQASFLRGDGTWAVPTNTTYNVATTSADGLMSKADKSKLDNMEEGANLALPIDVEKIDEICV